MRQQNEGVCGSHLCVCCVGIRVGGWVCLPTSEHNYVVMDANVNWTGSNEWDEERVILMEVSDRAEEERGVGLRVLKVHSEDSEWLLSRRVPVKTTFITHIDQNQPPPKHRPFDGLLEGSHSEALDPGGALVSPPCCPQPSVFTEQISYSVLHWSFLH